jgi:hypothetical protein
MHAIRSGVALAFVENQHRRVAAVPAEASVAT